MKERLKDRSILIGEYIIETGGTVRKAAAHFGISKSTVHKDVTERLKKISPSVYMDVKAVLENNLKERHIRGGLATKNKYLLKKMAT